MKKIILFDISNLVLKNLLEVVFTSDDSFEFSDFHKDPTEFTETDEYYLITDDAFNIAPDELNKFLFKKVFFIGEASESEKVIPLSPSNCSNFIINYFKNDGKVQELPGTDRMSYLSIPIGLVKEISNAPCSLHIKLKKGQSYDYIKRFSQDEELDQSSLQNYINKGEHNLYYKASEKGLVEEFFKSLYLDSMFNEISSQTLNKNTQAVKYMFKEFGISSESCEFVNNLSTSIVKNISDDESSSVIKNALLEKSDLYFKKSLITTTIASSILKSLSWGNESHIELIAKLTLICDVFLDERSCLINTQEKLLKSSFSDLKKEKILHHALDAFNKFKNTNQLDEETLTFIKIHHGKEDGIGFVDQLPQNASPLLMVYRVSEDFAIELILEAEKNNFNVVKIYEQIKEMHSNIAHQDIIKQAFFSIYALMKTAA